MNLPGRLSGLLAIGVALAVARALMGVGEIPQRGSDLGAHDETPSTCRMAVLSAISEKLVCPGQSVEVRYTLSVDCDSGSAANVRSIRLVSPIPDGVTPYDPGSRTGLEDELEPVWRFEHDGPMVGDLSAAYRVRAVEPGKYAVGAASVELIDSEGGTLTRSTAPHSLMVSGECPMSHGPREHRSYLPILQQPGCTPASAPADVVVLIDRSSSVGDGGLHDPVRHAGDLIASLPLSRDRAGIIAFDQRPERLTGFVRDRHILEGALQAVFESGSRPGTRIERALVDARRMFESDSPAGRRKIVVLISDGVQLGPGGKGPVRDAAAELRDFGARILPLGIGPAPDMALLEAIAGPSGAARAGNLAGSVDGMGAEDPGEFLALAVSCQS